MKKRKMYDDQFKAKVTLEAVKGEKTIAEIAGSIPGACKPDMVLEKAFAGERVRAVFVEEKPAAG